MAPGVLSIVSLIAASVIQLLLAVVYLYVGVSRRLPKTIEHEYSQISRADRKILEEHVLRRRDFLVLGLVYLLGGVLTVLRLQLTVAEEDELAFAVQFLIWAVVAPLLLFDIGLLLNMSTDIVVTCMLIQVSIITCGYIGHVATDHRFKFMWFALGFTQFSFNVTCYFQGARRKFQMETPVINFRNLTTEQRFLARLLGLTLVSWLLYPTSWILEEMGALTSDQEVLLHQIMAGVSKLGFGLLVWANRISQTNFVAKRRASVAPGTPMFEQWQKLDKEDAEDEERGQDVKLHLQVPSGVSDYHAGDATTTLSPKTNLPNLRAPTTSRSVTF